MTIPLEPTTESPTDGAPTETAETVEEANTGQPPKIPNGHSEPTQNSESITDTAGSSALPAASDTTLTPLRAHYLKKALVSLQFNKEMTYISSSPLHPPLSVFSLLGPPFTPLPRSAIPTIRDVPFLRFMFRQFVLTFPFLAPAPKDFFPSKLQPFLDSLLSRNLSSELILFPEEDMEQADPEHSGTAKALAKVEKHMALLLGNAIKVVEKEEVVRLSQKDLDKLENAARRRENRYKRREIKGDGEVEQEDGRFGVNVICVRSVSERGRVRRRTHDEFVIRTRRPGAEDIFVSRRYGDFRSLADELRKHHPMVEIPPPPQKDRTSVTSNGTTVPSASRLRTSKSQVNLSSASSPSSTPRWNDSNDSLPNSPTTTGSIAPSSPLQRERNRLTLRSYLNALLAQPTIAASPVFRSFLTMDPIQLTEEEEMDAKRREELDAIREEGKNQFEKEVSDRVDKLRDALKDVKGDLMGPDGLTHIFSVIRQTPDVNDLPPNFQAVLEWGRISLASTIFHHFIASDSGHESLQGLKRIHGLMPYFMLKGILRISNPVGMIRGVMDLFMAQPFGGRSLLQRMFTSSMSEEVKELEAEIAAVKDKVDDEVMCEKIRQYIYAPKEIQAIYKADALEEQMNLLVVILRSPEEPTLNRPQMQRLARAARAHQAYIRSRMEADDSDDDEGPEDEAGWLLEDLGVLIRLYARLRDRQQMIELIFEGTTSDLLRDIITIFYSPLAQVYKAASIADSLGDMQNFINDLIRTVEQGEEMSQEEPSKTVELFINLVTRHQQAFYTFVHKVQTKGEGLFDSLMRWVELFLTFVREGVSQTSEKISLEFLLPHTGDERAKILKEVDAIALYHYKLKVAYEAKIRRRFLRQSGAARDAAAEEEEAAQAMLDNVIGELQFGSLIKGDTEELFAEDEEEFSSDEDVFSDEYSTSDDDDDASVSTGDGAATTSESSVHPAPETPPARTKVSHAPNFSLSSSPSPSPSSHTHSRNISEPPRMPTRPPPPPPGRASIDKPLPPPPPPKDSPAMNGRRRASSVGPSQQPQPRLRKVKKTDQTQIEPPELKVIPELLPIFVELVSANTDAKRITF
ncbi:hypothetical protein DL93DRAFT_2062783 [Clavulina sp. PMI_390]|nr:hypothetical protein DL93DRAFT_2062783 [Clavulina sp. PMI_390]